MAGAQRQGLGQPAEPLPRPGVGVVEFVFFLAAAQALQPVTNWRAITTGRQPPCVCAYALTAVNSCAHCADPLKGAAARGLGVCGVCLRSAPGSLGRVARQAIQVSVDAANATGKLPEELLRTDGLLRLVDKRPSSADEVAATLGVELSGKWASRMAVVLGSF